MPPVQIALWALLGLALVVSVVTDFLSRRILDVVTYPAMALALGLRWIFSDGSFEVRPALGTLEAGLLSGAISALGAMALFSPMAWRGRMGWGDVKLAGAMGAAFGYPLIMAAMVFVSLVGALQAIVALLWHGEMAATFTGILRRWAVRARLLSKEEVPDSERRHIPYGVAIAVGSFWAMWWGRSNLGT